MGSLPPSGVSSLAVNDASRGQPATLLYTVDINRPGRCACRPAGVAARPLQSDLALAELNSIRLDARKEALPKTMISRVSSQFPIPRATR
jgi:hypothetical protein